MKKKLKKISYKELIIMVILLVIISLGTVTLAKYVIREFHSYYLDAKHFYFTSNRLKKNNPTYLVNNWSGVGSFNISFDLLSMKNSLVYTDYDIPYTVTFTCPSDVSCSLDKQAGTVLSSNANHSDTVTLSVSPTRSYAENERLQVYVEASSTSPYVETIGAYFEYVVGKQGVTYNIEDEANRTYLVLKITNAINYCKVIADFDNYHVNDLIESNVYRGLSAENRAKCVGEGVQLDFDPNVLRLDTTSNIMDVSTYANTTISGVDYINRLNFYIEPVSTMAIKFYKINTANNYTYPITNNSSIVTVTFS